MKDNYLMKRWIKIGDVQAGEYLTQCLQGSAQCFAGANMSELAGMCKREQF